MRSVQQDVKDEVNRKKAESMVACTTFIASHPNESVGQVLRNGFLTAPSPILLLAHRSDLGFAIVPSSQAYIPSHGIEAFIPNLPILSSDSPLYRVLENADRIKRLSLQHIPPALKQNVLDPTQLVSLLNWFFNNGEMFSAKGVPETKAVTEAKKTLEVQAKAKNKARKAPETEFGPRTVAGFSEVLSFVQFRIKDGDGPRLLAKVLYYDENLPASLPLSSQVLPVTVTSALSTKQLKSCLNLQALTPVVWLELLAQIPGTLTRRKTVTSVLSYLSRQSGAFRSQDWKHVKRLLAGVKCIPCTTASDDDGQVKLLRPDECYLRNQGTPGTLPQVALRVVKGQQSKQKSKSQKTAVSDEDSEDEDEDEDGADTDSSAVSEHFLTQIGVHKLPSLLVMADTAETHNSSSIPMEAYVNNLIESSRTGNAQEFKKLRESPCLRGVKFSELGRRGESKTDTFYTPSELHFPFVAAQLQAPDLLVLDWPDKKFGQDGSEECTAFLKRLGVLMAPGLKVVMNLMALPNPSRKKSKSSSTFEPIVSELPPALEFFLRHFREHYASRFKPSSFMAKRYLPGARDDRYSGDDALTLCRSDEVFSDPNPFLPTLSSAVLDLCRELDINPKNQLGVREYPTMAQCLSSLSKSPPYPDIARSVFASIFDRAEGFTPTNVDKLFKTAFIPVGSKLLSPSQIYLRPGSADASLLSAGEAKGMDEDDDEADEDMEVKGKRAAAISVLQKRKHDDVFDHDGRSWKKGRTRGRAAASVSVPAESLEELDIEALVDYVDFRRSGYGADLNDDKEGLKANCFLLTCRASSTLPSPTQLAEFVLKNHHRYLVGKPERVKSYRDIIKVHLSLMPLSLSVLIFFLL